ILVVDYKPGGGTIIGTQYVAGSEPDGYTLGMAISAHMINPSLQPSLPYDTKKDLVGVSQVALSHFGLFAHPSFPADTIAGLTSMHASIPARSAMPRPAPAPAPISPARCSTTWPGSTWSTCPTRAVPRRSRM